MNNKPMKEWTAKEWLITILEGIGLFLFFCLDWEMIFGLK